MSYELGKKIKLLRMSRNMTQEQLAEKLNITPQSVSKWENEITAPDIQLLPEISVLFGVTIDELFSITDESKLKRIENLLLNASEDTIISDTDFESYKNFLGKNEDNPALKNRILSTLADLYIQQSNAYRHIAANYAVKAIEADPCEKRNHSALCYALNGAARDWYIKSKSKIIDYYIRFIKTNPENIHAYQILLDNLISDNRICEAENFLNCFEKLDNGCRSSFYRAHIYYAKGELDMFKCCIEQMQERFADDWLCWSCCGDLYAFAAQYDKATECFKQAF